MFIQKVLNELSYKVEREDGYFEESTYLAIQQFTEDHKMNYNANVINEDLYSAILEQIVIYKGNRENDRQLQVGLHYILQQLMK